MAKSSFGMRRAIRMRRAIWTLLMLVVSATFTGTARADSRNQDVAPDRASVQVQVRAAAQGWYDATGFFAGPSNPNYAVGFGDPPNPALHNWFVFDLSVVSGKVQSARIEADNPEPAGLPLAKYTLFDVSTPIETLMTPHYQGGEGALIFADLGSGKAYGSTAITDPLQSPVVVVLNKAGQGAVATAEGGRFAVGGAYSTSTGYLFGNTGGVDKVILVLTLRP